ncbi:MAG TPA: DNA repair protein RecN [Trebonia sp.]|jgi:DNA repair protein RecN (Recombination protein N)|nr:DNA repair protein RecN [Trebonia sp.]
MLEEVRITGLGVIDDALLELSPGFTALTGETGAGKTMVVTGLGMLFGGKADPARIRPGATRAAVEGRLRIAANGKVAQQVEEAGGELDEDGSLVLTRSVSTEGRSRASVGGTTANVSLLMSLADDLVAVHGQSDQQQLLKPGRQREALDKYAGGEFTAFLADYQRVYQRHKTVKASLAEITAATRERAAEAEVLRAGLAEIEKLEPADGEDEGLRAEDERLANADALHSGASVAHEALQGDPSAGLEGADALTLLGHARSALDSVARYDAQLAGLASRLSEAIYLLSDLAGELASYVQSVDADPARLAAVQERRSALGRLIRSYGYGGPFGLGTAVAEPPADYPDGSADPAGQGEPAVVVQGTVAAVLDWARHAAARLTELDGDDVAITELTAAEAQLAAEVSALAGRLSQLREEAAERFAGDVTTELAALAMPHARISAVISRLAEPGPYGLDDVELRLAPNPGAPLLPLHKGASGGELSRVMLAIEVVFAGADPVPTFVFDEVDAGVGGKAAVEIGRRLAKLARMAQVIVVTHLPQVAAFADNHLVVAKASDGRITSSGVIRLDHDGRVRELSRMLAGMEDSEFGQAHAAELLALAAEQAARA